MRTVDEDVEKYLRMLTLSPLDRIESVMNEHHVWSTSLASNIEYSHVYRLLQRPVLLSVYWRTKSPRWFMAVSEAMIVCKMQFGLHRLPVSGRTWSGACRHENTL